MAGTGPGCLFWTQGKTRTRWGKPVGYMGIPAQGEELFYLLYSHTSLHVFTAIICGEQVQTTLE